MDEIEDVRALQNGATYRTYSFTYDITNHLPSISSHIGTAENYTFGYSGSYTLNSPFSPYPPIGSTKSLVTATIAD